MSRPATKWDRGNGLPCPGCGYALRPLDRCRDACRTCGLIVPNTKRVRRLLRLRMGATGNYLAPG
jgi:hypothetical protein